MNNSFRDPVDDRNREKSYLQENLTMINLNAFKVIEDQHH